MNTPPPCPELQTERLYLQPIQEADAHGLWTLWSSKDFAQMAGIEPAQSITDIDANISYFKTLNGSGFYYKWAIKDKQTLEFLGEFELYPLKPQIRPWGEWGVGFSLTPRRWREGLMTEALSCVLTHAFSQLHAIRIKADVHLYNKASLALLQKMGFIQEGVQRSKLQVGTQIHDMLLLSLTPNDFAQQNSQNE